jgi:hypothetical protein
LQLLLKRIIMSADTFTGRQAKQEVETGSGKEMQRKTKDKRASTRKVERFMGLKG